MIKGRDEKDPLVSIITSTYREVLDGTLSKSIKSILNQTYPNLELVVVADHSPDSDRIQRLIEWCADKRIRYANLPKNGGSLYPGLAPKEKGVELAKGDIICFLDADNEYTPNHIQTAVSELKANPESDLVYCDTLFELQRPIWGTRLPFLWEKSDWTPKRKERLQKTNFIDMSEAVMKKSSYEAAGGLKPTLPYGIDWTLWKDMIKAGKDNFRHVPETGSIYHTGSLGQHLGCYASVIADENMLPVPNMERYLLKHGESMQKRVEAKQKSYAA